MGTFSCMIAMECVVVVVAASLGMAWCDREGGEMRSCTNVCATCTRKRTSNYDNLAWNVCNNKNVMKCINCMSEGRSVRGWGCVSLTVWTKNWRGIFVLVWMFVEAHACACMGVGDVNVSDRMFFSWKKRSNLAKTITRDNLSVCCSDFDPTCQDGPFAFSNSSTTPTTITSLHNFFNMSLVINRTGNRGNVTRGT